LFKAQEYWSISATFESDGTPFTARLVGLDGKKIDRLSIGDKGSADAAKAVVEAGRFTVASVETKPFARNPPAPFTTSTLQQEASRKLGFSASHTMRLAQSLYEDGLITYMRTDGVQMADEAISAARRAIADRYDAGYVPDKPRVYTTKAKNAQEAHEAIRPTDFHKDRGGSGDHAKLYGLIFNRALASQMASARLERTTVELTDGAGRATLRATGQVVLFPGYLALYEEGRDEKADDEDAVRMPALRSGDSPAKTGVESVQSFTQPPPRYSEASLVKRMEELGIGRPSTYAATLQTLKDREYVRTDKNRFHPEESGRLVTAFLERFFERYVNYDYTAELEEGLDDVSGGRLGWQQLLEAFWTDFKPKAGEVMEQKPSDVTVALDEFLAPWLFPEKEDGSDPRLCPACGTGRLALRGGKFGSFVACANYPECKYTQKFGQGGAEGAASEGPTDLGEGVTLRSGRFGPYVQQGEEKDAKRASVPKDVGTDGLTLEMALNLLSLPRVIGIHPETGNPISASIGRYGPYLLHDGKYARLTSTAEVFETGMNAAVVKLAEAAAAKGQRGGGREPLAMLGMHPETAKELKVMEGRYGPYVTDGTTHATLPKSADPAAVTLDEAVALIDAKAAKGPGVKKRKAPAKKAAAKKAPAKKAAAKKKA
jgi:DNA topoisomerase-1